MDQRSNDSNKKPVNKFDIDFSPLRDFMQNMDRFFNQSFKHINSHLNWNPLLVETYETDKEVIIKAELPGYSPEDIQLEIISNRLRIVVDDHQIIENDVEQSKQEYRQKRERVVSLPFVIPEKETKASFHNGLLKIAVPKKNSKRKFLDIHDS
jgi:HSP20 family protein